MDPHAVLGLPRGASEEDAKIAFRTLAKTCHPDLNPGNAAAEQRFKEINAAYDAIRNPTPDPFQQVPFHDFPFGGGSPFEDLFANLRGYTRQRNNDIHLECRITLDEVFHGKDLDIALPVPDGRTIKVRLPPGVEDGTNVLIAQAGDHTNKALRPGDLHLLIRVLPHASLTRVGRNLIITVSVTAFDVLLGKEIEVTGIDGKNIRIAIPVGFDTSHKMRLSGQGMQDNSGRGDLLIELFVIFPALSDEQRALIIQATESPTRDSPK